MPKPIIINVLDPAYYEDCHIKGSINVPVNKLVEYVAELPKDTEIILYCAHYQCPASKKAWHSLNLLGYTNIWAYEGGIVEWFQKGLPIEGPCTHEFLKEQHSRPSTREDLEVKEITSKELLAKISSS